MSTAFFASFLIGLRDGLEASLVVSILTAFLVKAGRRDRLFQVWAGVGAAVVVAAALGVLLTTVADSLRSGTRMELFEAVTSLAAVALVTWMIFWMRRTARTLKGELTGKLNEALAMGGLAVAGMAFLAVVREGVEMVLLVFAAAESASTTTAPLIGMVAGVATAVLLGWAMARAVARINLGRFFAWTGALLVLVAAGIFKYGVHGLQVAGILPGGQQQAYDLTTTIDPTSWYATVLAGTVNITPQATVLEVVAWVGFAAIVLALFFRPTPTRPTPTAQAPARALGIGGVAAIVALLPASCGGSPTAEAPANPPIAVDAGDTTCGLATASLASGTHTFEITNSGSKITEFYVYAKGERIVGEVENIAPGLARRLTVELPAGSYAAVCKPGMVGDGIRSTLTVTGSSSPALADDAALAAAAASYERYVRTQAGAFVDATAAFTTAVRKGDRATAKRLYPTARTYFERIETVAESFGDLDPRIDARDGDLDPGTAWTGYHRLEKDLWSNADLKADAAIADTLLADVTALRDRLATTTLRPLDLANGAKSLLDEVATKKVTGEEDRYSHTDLWDFAANVEGSKAAIAALRPILDARQPDLGVRIDQGFATVTELLATHRRGDGYVSYADLTREQVRALANAIDALAEPVSTVAAVIATR
ncbi:FTR1 family protein [Asanoa ferruginea]|uniref:FTR1 family protein n=1 Tax=Asanoa ferruginea TaxID=53367 RepID=A0A3D9ZUE2_9ACTN|nr:iron uptake system protein EfeO [Asanoa ferruginea]REG00832.1 FTR1 family protein [Asanoa ferruginea]GIF47293.1 hypothetical protein Afe04nite_18320 [Asanoa ferruginea]